MSVIPFVPRAPSGAGGRTTAVPAVLGSFASPSGGIGRFEGSYRVERFIAQGGKLAVAGVFTGELTDSDGSQIGVGSRRRTAPVRITVNGPALQVRLAPQRVNLLGLMVAIDEVAIDLVGTNPANPRIDDLRHPAEDAFPHHPRRAGRWG